MTTLAVESLTVEFGERRILDGVSLTVPGGVMVGLIGPNGAGKTTLLRACAGLIAVASGAVRIDGVPIFDFDRRRLARILAYLPQQATCHWPLEVERLVALGRLPHLQPWQRPTGRDASAVQTALCLADVGHLTGRNVLALSGGERARVLLARALAGDPALLLADEPVAGLDPEHQLRMMEVLHERCRRGAGIIVTMHDLGLAARFCDRLVLLSEGRIVADGPPRTVLTAGTLASVFHIRADIGDRAGHPVIVPLDVVRSGERPSAVP
jgi:iron complex transport system ATP-binding protein